jgi:hypothetical protein
MSFYDSGGTYDSTLTYDQAAFINPTHKMSKVKLELKKKLDAALNTFAKDHIGKMTGNVNFTTPDPAAADFLILSNDYDTALTAAIAAQLTAKEKTAVKDAKRLALEAGLTARGKYVDLKSGGDKVKILSAGFDVAGDRAPLTVPDPVANLAVTAGDSAGELDLQWDPVSGAKSYEAQLCADAAFAANIITLKSVTKSKAMAEGLTTGTRMWARVRATNAAGTGAWSDVAT